jgi:type IV secretion system protein VirD4
MRNIWATNQGIYLGQQVAASANPDNPLEGNGPPLKVWPVKSAIWRFPSSDNDPENPGDTHIFTVGPNGSGKTQRLLIPNLFRLVDWSIVVIDPKGELAAKTALYRANHTGPDGRPHRVRIIDPFRVMAESYPDLYAKHRDLFTSAGLNPLASIESDRSKPGGMHFADAAKVLAQALIKIEEKGERYWSESAQALVTGLIMAECLEHPNSKSLKRVRSWIGMSAGAFAERLKTKVSKSDPDYEPGLIDKWGKAYPTMAEKLNRFTEIKADNKELMGIIGNAATQIDWLGSELVATDLDKGDFDYTRIKSEPTTTYLILPPDYLESHAAWLRVVLATIMRPLLRSTQNARVPVLFMLDEFAQLGHVEIVVKNVAIMRQFGVKIWPIFQNLAQAKQVYNDLWENFVSNSGVVQTFAPQDMTSRDYFQNLSGKRFFRYKTTSGGSSTNYGGGGPSQGENVGEGEGVMEVPCLYGQDLANMGKGQAVLFGNGTFARSFLEWPDNIPWVRQAMAQAAALANRPALSKPAAATPSGAKAVVSCPSCGTRCRVPSDRGRIEVKCPSCKKSWRVDPSAQVAAPPLPNVDRVAVPCTICGRPISVPSDRDRTDVKCSDCKGSRRTHQTVQRRPAMNKEPSDIVKKLILAFDSLIIDIQYFPWVQVIVTICVLPFFAYLV